MARTGFRSRASIEGVRVWLGYAPTAEEAKRWQEEYEDFYCKEPDRCHHRHHVRRRGGALTRTEHRHKAKVEAKGETWHRNR